MTKQELLSTYTAEQLAEMVVECEIVKEQYEISTNWEKSMPEHELKAKFNYETAKIKYENERLKTTITQIDEILEELFGVKYDAVQYGEFGQFLREKVTEKVTDFLPTEPIKIADMLISATYTRKKGDMEKALHKALGNNPDTVTESVYSKSELRQIAEHMLVYCNYNEGEEEEHKLGFILPNGLYQCSLQICIDRERINAMRLYPADKDWRKIEPGEKIDYECGIAKLEVADIQEIAFLMNKETFEKFCKLWREYHMVG